MPRWLRVARGMIGTGLTFAAGVGVVASITGLFVRLGHGITGLELMQIVGKFSVVAFLLGVAFSGVLAIAARGREFNKLSLRLVGALGAGAGLLYFVFLALNGGRNWSAPDAIANFVLLVVMGAGSAAATLAIARKARSALESSDEVRSLGVGDDEIVRGRSSSKVETPRL
ncbi:MAG: putative rane protein [Gemmatimonadetes bacterium]|nr:putative rane protein [Gemmatimonadota bacterium]